MSADQRFEKLEEEVAHLRLANEELSSELVVHLRKIESIEKMMSVLDQRFKGLEENLDGPIENQKPPHW